MRNVPQLLSAKELAWKILHRERVQGQYKHRCNMCPTLYRYILYDDILTFYAHNLIILNA